MVLTRRLTRLVSRHLTRALQRSFVLACGLLRLSQGSKAPERGNEEFDEAFNEKFTRTILIWINVKLYQNHVPEIFLTYTIVYARKMVLKRWVMFWVLLIICTNLILPVICNATIWYVPKRQIFLIIFALFIIYLV